MALHGRIRELSLFTGAGGGLLGTVLLGWQPVCAVEKEPYRREVLLRRQRDGVLPMFPVWDQIETFDGRPWRGKVDCVTAGFPCQPFSVAGKQRGAADVGAPHLRRRLWIVAYVPHSRYGIESEFPRGSRRENKQRQTVGPELGGDGEVRDVADAEEQSVRPGLREGEQDNRERQSARRRRSGDGGCETGEVPDAVRTVGEPGSGRWGIWEAYQAKYIDWWSTESEICRVVDGLVFERRYEISKLCSFRFSRLQLTQDMRQI